MHAILQVDAERQRLVDAHGNERLFHGVNVVSKAPPYLPRTDRFDPDDSVRPVVGGVPARAEGALLWLCRQHRVQALVSCAMTTSAR